MTLYFLFDCETGGLPEEKASLLTLYGCVLNKDLDVVDSIDLFVKPDAGAAYTIHPRAMDINKIDLAEHDKKAIPMRQAARAFTGFLLKNSGHKTNDYRYTAIGHQVEFDLYYAKKLFDKNQFGAEFSKVFTRYVLDTKSLALFHQMAGKLPKNTSISLEGLAKYFNLSYGNAHNAEFDVKLTLSVFKELLKL